jgi:hypothetical protein
MAQTLEFHTRVNKDGSVDLHVPVAGVEAGTEVIVTIRPAARSSPPQMDLAQWHRFVDETYGSCADLNLERQPQGALETRESLE